MITMVDSNILVDIFGADPQFGESSGEKLRECIREGGVYACEVVWAEVASIFSHHKTFIHAMDTLGVEFSAINQETALFAAQMWRRYRAGGGKKGRVAADFLIGAHAKIQGNRLLTRDRGFYRTYFDRLTVVL